MASVMVKRCDECNRDIEDVEVALRHGWAHNLQVDVKGSPYKLGLTLSGMSNESTSQDLCVECICKKLVKANDDKKASMNHGESSKRSEEEDFVGDVRGIRSNFDNSYNSGYEAEPHV